MKQETKICSTCSQAFAIVADDFSFYERLKVPPPTLCPDCRQRRRYAWRNERTLYRRTCDLCDKNTVTIYSPNKSFKVYCPPCWWSDNWTALDYGRDFDFGRPFFPQWQELQFQVPRIALLTKNSTNSEYTNHASNNKNCYLTFGVMDSENVMYSTNVFNVCHDVMDSYWIENGCERLYQCINAYKSYRCQYGVLLQDCVDCFYSFDLRGCSNCFLSCNLRNQQYRILNEPYSKEGYFEKLKEWDLGSFAVREELYKKYQALLKEKALYRFAFIERSVNCSGNFVFGSKNSRHLFDVDKAENSAYLTTAPEVKDSMDAYHFGFATELVYESHALIHAYDNQFCHLSYHNRHIRYCDGCHNSENLFGCVGVKQGSYCVFNKKYSEHEYADLVQKIIAHMKQTGEYGEFFPAEMSPFGYNETQGQVYMPLTKDAVVKRGWKWEDRVPGTFGKGTLKPADIPEKIEDVQDAITKEILACISCTKNYNTVQPELDFYRRENIPIPRLCPDCRYLSRIALRPPRKLWQRHCMCNAEKLEIRNEKLGGHTNTVSHFHGENSCPNEFETPFAPDSPRSSSGEAGRPEVVYCESCYNSEVA